MTISGLGANSLWNSWVPDTLTQIHTTLNTTAQQMATGKVGQTYASFGDNAAKSIDLQSKLSEITASGLGITAVNTSLSMANDALTAMTDLASSVSAGPLSPLQSNTPTARAGVQSSLRQDVGALLDYMNTQDGDSYVFGGRVQDKKPALDLSTVLDGDPTTGKIGLSGYIAERQAADLGANGLGRLNLRLPSGGTTVSLDEEAAGLPFGMTLNSVSSTMDNATTALSSTAPKTLDIAFTGVPTVGSTFNVTLNLPDGSTTNVTLTASASAGTNQFVVGSDAATTAANFKAALSSSLQTTASSALANASAMKASKDFFSGSLTSPPQRVAIPSGGSAATATGFVTDPVANAANTVIWYQGTDANESGDPLNDRVMQLPSGISVGFGIRGNQAGFAGLLAAMGAGAVVKLSTTDETLAENQISDLAQRAKAGVVQAQTDLKPTILALANAQTQTKDASDQNTASGNVLTSMMSSIEDASPEQTAAQLSQLQTQLQVAYQVTASLLKMTLATYL